MNRYDLGYGSHVPILAAAVARTTGPVIELGMGWWSTPLLHMLCRDRQLLSCETDPLWFSGFQFMQSSSHVMRQVESWKRETDIDRIKWDVAFVDSHPGEMRPDLVLRLKEKVRFIVCHDTEADIPPSGGNYGWKRLEGAFKYEVIYKEVRPWTTVYSDFEEFKL